MRAWRQAGPATSPSHQGRKDNSCRVPEQTRQARYTNMRALKWLSWTLMTKRSSRRSTPIVLGAQDDEEFETSSTGTSATPPLPWPPALLLAALTTLDKWAINISQWSTHQAEKKPDVARQFDFEYITFGTMTHCRCGLRS